MEKPRIGVVGAGSMGLNHIRVYDAMKDRCVLAGIYDADVARAQSVAQAHGIKAFDSLDALLEAVDAISVVVPTAYHQAVALAAMQHGVHLLVEKPIADTLQAAESMAEAAEAAGVVLQVGHIERFNPVVTMMPDILQGKRLLALDFRRLSPFDPRVRDVDVVLDLMIHDLDVMLHLLGGDVTGVQALGSAPRSPGRADHAVALLEVGGVPVCLTASRVTEQKVRSLCVTTEQAYIEMNYLERRISMSRVTHSGFSLSAQGSYRQEGIVEKVFVPNGEPLRLELEHFLERVADGQTPLVSAADGIAALRVAERIRECIYKV